MDFGIKGKKALVVGASKNIGAAIAKALADEGCKVTVVARDKAKLKKLMTQMGGVKGGHHFFVADLLTAGVPSRIAKQLLSEVGPFDILVHNIGGALGLKDPLGKIEDWSRVWQFNIGIAIELNRLLVPPMQKMHWGRIIHISSMAAEVGEPTAKEGGSLPYTASKAYLNAYVKGLGRELARYNIVVSALMPGVVLSKGKYWDNLSRRRPTIVKKYLLQHSSIGRFGKAKEIAPFAVLLASRQAAFAAGAIIPIHGGLK
jgi:3-oxoacyl-[acyl-carrier protein] reductase